MKVLGILDRYRNAFAEVRRNDVFRRFTLFTLERFVRLILAFVLGAAVARHLGPHGFGLMAYAISLVSLVSVFCSFGVDSLVLRDLGRKAADERTIVASAAILRIGTGMVGVLLCIGYLLCTETVDETLRVLILIQSMVLLFGWGDVVDSWFQSGAKFWVGVTIRLGACLFGAGLRLYLLLTEASSAAFIAAGAVESAVLAICLWAVFLRNRSGAESLSVSWTVIKSLLGRGWPLMLSSVLVTSTLQSDRILLGYFSSAEQLGLYAASARFLDLSLTLPLLLSIAARKFFVQETVGRHHARTLRVERMFKYGVWAAIFVGVGLWITAKWIVPLAFGAKYTDASTLLAIHAWVVIFVMQVSLRSGVLMAEGRQHTILIISLFTAIFQWAVLPWAISRAGAFGAAYVTLASWICSAWVFPMFFKGTRWFVFVSIRAIFLPFKL